MPLTRIDKSAPNEYSAVRLYLEDIDEIVALLSETVEQVAQGRYPESPTEVEFKIGNLLSTNIRDFIPRFKSVQDVSIYVSKGHRSVELAIERTRVSWFAAPLSKEQGWIFYRKLESIIGDKKLRYRTFRTSPLGMFLGWVLFLASMAAMILDLASRTRVTHAVWIIATVAMYASFAVDIGMTRRGTVVFRSASDHRTHLEENLWKFVWLVAGVLGTLLTIYVKHKFWP